MQFTRSKKSIFDDKVKMCTSNFIDELISMNPILEDTQFLKELKSKLT